MDAGPIGTVDPNAIFAHLGWIGAVLFVIMRIGPRILKTWAELRAKRIEADSEAARTAHASETGERDRARAERAEDRLERREFVKAISDLRTETARNTEVQRAQLVLMEEVTRHLRKLDTGDLPFAIVRRSTDPGENPR